MSDAARLQRTWIDVGLITGVLAGIAYAVPQVPWIRGWVHHLFWFAFGPLLTVAAVGLYHAFRLERETVSGQIAHGFLSLAGVSFTFMATMQTSIFRQIGRAYRDAAPDDRQLWRDILTGVSPAQLGLDFAFDIFVSCGTILLGWQMVRHRRFWTAFGLAGMIIGATGLTFNFVTFPENSGEAGLVDPGPFFGIWLTLAVVQLIRIRGWLFGQLPLAPSEPGSRGER